MNFRMNPVSIVGASPLAYIYMHKKVALVTRKLFLNLLSLNSLPLACISLQTFLQSLALYFLNGDCRAFFVSKSVMNAVL